jgi:SAM-dependent methyltransferase
VLADNCASDQIQGLPVKPAAPTPPARPGTTQDYERVWDAYSENFGKAPSTAGARNLGDEWGNTERRDRIFKAHLLPHLKAAHHVGELGVGGGKYSVLVAPLVHTLYGIDISTQMLKRTEERMRDAGGRFVPCKTEGADIPLADGQLDFFFSIDSAVHIFPYDLYGYLVELQRVLKPNALAVIEFADPDLEGSVQKFLMDYGVFRKSGQLSPGAFGFISPKLLVNLAVHAGLESVDIKPVSRRTSLATFRKP